MEDVSEEEDDIRRLPADKSNRPALVLFGQTGAKKSSTGNHLCGLENLPQGMEGEELATARRNQYFKATSLEEFDGESCTKQVVDNCDPDRPDLQKHFYVVDTPGFGDTESTGVENMAAKDELTALQLVEHLHARKRRIDALVLFLAEPMQASRNTAPKMTALKRFLEAFGNVQEVLDHLIFAQPVDLPSEIKSKAYLAEVARKRVVKTLSGLLTDPKDEETMCLLGIKDCKVPSNLPYALYCPFPPPVGEAKISACEDNSPNDTVKAFQQALDMVKANLIAAGESREVRDKIAPQFPCDRCERCSYDRRVGHNRAPALKAADGKCHPEVKALTAWQRIRRTVVRNFPRTESIAFPVQKWPSYDEGWWYCRHCRHRPRTEGCTPLSSTVQHQFPEAHDY